MVVEHAGKYLIISKQFWQRFLKLYYFLIENELHLICKRLWFIDLESQNILTMGKE